MFLKCVIVGLKVCVYCCLYSDPLVLNAAHKTTERSYRPLVTTAPRTFLAHSRRTEGSL
eukprot:COSAG02_NODE_5092_length_4640_cov_3.630478_3_plen_59_part_00